MTPERSTEELEYKSAHAQPEEKRPYTPRPKSQIVLAWVLLAVVLGLSLGKQKDIGVLLTMAVCCMVAMIAISYLEPVLDFLRELDTLGDLQGDMLGILLKAVGIGLVSEIAGLVCTDAGNGSLGKTLQMLGSAVILYLSLPIFTAMLELIREILREL